MKEIKTNDDYQKLLEEEKKLKDWNKQLGYDVSKTEDFKISFAGSKQ